MDLPALLTGIDWHGLAVPTIAILEKILRPVIVYFFLIIALRVAGKRELAQVNTFDFVVLLLLSNTVQNAIIGNDNSVSGGLIGAISLLVVNYLMVRFLYRHRGLDRVFEGRPDLLIHQGRLNQKKLAKDLITREELELAARQQGIANLADVERAELDSNGQIVFVAKAPTTDERRHAELLATVAALQQQIVDLTTEVKALRSSRA